MGELEFRQRWEYRRRDNDLDSSCDQSKSSNEQLREKHKLVSSLSSVGDDETSETGRLKQKENDNVGKAKKRKTRNNLRESKRKKDSAEEVDLQKGEPSAYEHAPVNDVKTFVEALLEELRVARENLVKWMMEEIKKMEADSTTPELKGRKQGSPREKVQLHQMQKSKKVQTQHEKTPKESMQFPHPNSFESSIQAQTHYNFQNIFQENGNLQVQLQEEEIFNRLSQNNFQYGNGMTIQNFHNRSSVKYPQSSNVADSTDYFDALEDRFDSGQVTELITSSKKNQGTSRADQTVQVEGHKTVVLAIEAQKGKDRSSKRSVKSKKTVDRSNQYQVPADQGGHFQVMRTSVASEKTNGEKLGSSILPNFLSSLSSQSPSSMYLTLPTVLTEPIVENHGLDASLCNYIPPRVANAEKKRDVNPMLEMSWNQGSLPVIQPEERIRSFAPMGSRNTGNSSQNGTLTSGTGTGFPVPLHQGMDVGLSIPRQVTPEYLSPENNRTFSFMMRGSGGSRYPWGSYNLSEDLATNHHRMHSAYKSDARLMPYQIQNVKDGHFFPQ